MCSSVYLANIFSPLTARKILQHSDILLTSNISFGTVFQIEHGTYSVALIECVKVEAVVKLVIYGMTHYWLHTVYG